MRCATPLKTQHFLPGGFLCGPYKLDLFICCKGDFGALCQAEVKTEIVAIKDKIKAEILKNTDVLVRWNCVMREETELLNGLEIL